MKQQQKFHLCLGALVGMILVVGAASCEEESKATGFETTSLYKTESDSVYTLRIYIGKVNRSTTVYVDVAGTAAQNVDFIVQAADADPTAEILPITGSLSSSQQQLVAKPGDSYVDMVFKLVDDSYVEPRNEIIYFQINKVSDENIDASLQFREHAFSITDNDTPPQNGMQVDLSWLLSSSDNVNDNNFDLYLVNNVVKGNGGEVISRNLISNIASVNATGFETITLNNSIADDVYYVMIRFVSGTSNADVELILSKNNSYSRAVGHIRTTSVGKDFYYGPITKSGNAYARLKNDSPDFLFE